LRHIDITLVKYNKTFIEITCLSWKNSNWSINPILTTVADLLQQHKSSHALSIFFFFFPLFTSVLYLLRTLILKKSLMATLTLRGFYQLFKMASSSAEGRSETQVILWCFIITLCIGIGYFCIVRFIVYIYKIG